MTWEITLKSVNYALYTSSDAEKALRFLASMDEEATKAEQKRAESKDIPPSALGRIVKKMSGQDFVEGTDSPVIRIAIQINPDSREEIRQSTSDLFLWLATFYASAILAGDEGHPPYVPMSWINQYIIEKSKDPEGTRILMVDAYKFLFEHEASEELVKPFQQYIGQLGLKGKKQLLLLIAMLLDAKLEGEERAKRRKKVEEDTKDWSPAMLDFIKGMDLDLESKT